MGLVYSLTYIGYLSFLSVCQSCVPCVFGTFEQNCIQENNNAKIRIIRKCMGIKFLVMDVSVLGYLKTAFSADFAFKSQQKQFVALQIYINGLISPKASSAMDLPSNRSFFCSWNLPEILRIRKRTLAGQEVNVLDKLRAIKWYVDVTVQGEHTYCKWT